MESELNRVDKFLRNMSEGGIQACFEIIQEDRIQKIGSEIVSDNKMVDEYYSSRLLLKDGSINFKIFTGNYDISSRLETTIDPDLMQAKEIDSEMIQDVLDLVENAFKDKFDDRHPLVKYLEIRMVDQERRDSERDNSNQSSALRVLDNLSGIASNKLESMLDGTERNSKVLDLDETGAKNRTERSKTIENLYLKLHDSSKVNQLRNSQIGKSESVISSASKTGNAPIITIKANDDRYQKLLEENKRLKSTLDQTQKDYLELRKYITGDMKANQVIEEKNELINELRRKSNDMEIENKVLREKLTQSELRYIEEQKKVQLLQELEYQKDIAFVDSPLTHKVAANSGIEIEENKFDYISSQIKSSGKTDIHNYFLLISKNNRELLAENEELKSKVSELKSKNSARHEITKKHQTPTLDQIDEEEEERTKDLKKEDLVRMLIKKDELIIEKNKQNEELEEEVHNLTSNVRRLNLKIRELDYKNSELLEDTFCKKAIRIQNEIQSYEKLSKNLSIPYISTSGSS